MRTAVLRVVAASLVLAATAAPTASAADRCTFGVQPSGPVRPDRRPNLSYSATPGATVHDHIAVSNYGAKPLTLRVYPSDAYTTKDGGYDLLPGTAKPVDVGSWIAVRRSTVTVPARGTVVVPFRLAIPASATPGDHSGGIVAALQTHRIDGKGNRVALEERVGARVYLRVAGPLDARLAITSLSAAYRDGGVSVRYAVRNTGNLRLGGRQRLAVDGLIGGPTTVTLPDLPELLPGNTLTLSARMSGVAPKIRLSATVTVDPVATADAPAVPLAPVSRTVELWAVPWLAAGLVLGLAGGAGAGAWWWRRRRPSGRHAAVPRRAAKVTAGTAAMARLATGWGSPTSCPTGGWGSPTAEMTAGDTQPGGASAAGDPQPVWRRISGAVVVAAVGAVTLLWPGPAYAGAAGWLAVSPARGNDESIVTLTTSGPCPAGTNVMARIHGRGFPAAGQPVVSNSPISAYEKTTAGGLVIPLAMTLRDFRNLQAEPVPLAGTYRVVVTCRDNVRTASLGDFTGSLTFSSPRAYTAAPPPRGETVAPVVPGQAAGQPPMPGATAPGTPGAPPAAPGGAAPAPGQSAGPAAVSEPAAARSGAP